MRVLRQALGLTQAQVAELSGIETSFYGQIERGANVPSLKTFLAIAQALDADPADLLPKPGRRDELPYRRAIERLVKDLGPKQKRFVLDTVRDIAGRLKR